MIILWQEEDIKNENLQRRIDEAEITILNQAKLVQSQALELEYTGPHNELCNKLQVSLRLTGFLQWRLKSTTND